MSEDPKDGSRESGPEIRIERMNTDKTRRDVGSDTAYHVYFELSSHPPTEWAIIFGREWKGLSPAHEATIDGGFLVLHCELHEVATKLLPALKRALASTNQAYTKYSAAEATALGLRKEVWRQEREDVDALATSLRFE